MLSPAKIRLSWTQKSRRGLLKLQADNQFLKSTMGKVQKELKVEREAKTKMRISVKRIERMVRGISRSFGSERKHADSPTRKGATGKSRSHSFSVFQQRVSPNQRSKFRLLSMAGPLSSSSLDSNENGESNNGEVS